MCLVYLTTCCQRSTVGCVRDLFKCVGSIVVVLFGNSLIVGYCVCHCDVCCIIDGDWLTCSTGCLRRM